MFDSKMVIQAEVSKQADFPSAAFATDGTCDLGSTGCMFAHIYYKTASDAQAPANSSAVFNIEHSFDGGNTWSPHVSGASQAVTLTTTVVAGKVILPVNTAATHIRLSLDITAGEPGVSTPTITYQAHLAPVAY